MAVNAAKLVAYGHVRERHQNTFWKISAWVLGPARRRLPVPLVWAACWRMRKFRAVIVPSSVPAFLAPILLDTALAGHGGAQHNSEARS